MKVFKFGGASVKDAEAVKNVANIVGQFKTEHLVIVVSAMGKTTNKLEWLINSYCYAKQEVKPALDALVDYHNEILWELFPDKSHQVYVDVNELFTQIEDLLEKERSENFDEVYDQFIGYGELISTTIVAQYLNFKENICEWLNVKQLIKTDHNFRQAGILWDETKKLVGKACSSPGIYVTQGFLGSTLDNLPTSLGREGSDFTASIFAYCLDATEVTIWKDVPGMLNADPKFYPNAKKLSKISYREAIELSYYGASVIHPKTVKPLQNKGIPLYIKSFINPNLEGSVIQESDEFDAQLPSFIFTNEQLLLSLSPRDFSFVAEGHLQQIFSVLHQLGIKVNLMQNSALSFSICFKYEVNKLKALVKSLEADYKILYNKDITLFSVRHYDEETIKSITNGKRVMLEQRTRTTARFALMD